MAVSERDQRDPGAVRQRRPAKGVGASLERKEDERFLHGRGEYVADLRLAGTRDVAFVRSPLAHAQLKGIVKPPGRESHVYTAADLAGVKAIFAPSGLPGFKMSEQPPLALGKVRHVGELIAACVADTRAQAEDLAAEVTVDLEALAVVSDMRAARRADAPLVHQHWGDNVFLESFVDGDVDSLAADAAVRVSRHFRTARQCMSPLEGRGVLAYWDRRLEMLVVYTACQMPHIVRNGLSECLGLDQEQIRVVSPDVGGGFGHKGIFLAEDNSRANNCIGNTTISDKVFDLPLNA